jgi:hypothetical protein
MATTSRNDLTEGFSSWSRSAVQDNVPQKTWPDGGRDLISVAVVLLLWVALWASRLHGPINLRWDASTYYVLGTALAEGKGYRLLNEPGEIEAVQYPPGLPALVAAHERALATGDYQAVGRGLRLTYFFLSGAYLVAVYFLVRTSLEPSLALVATAGTGLSFYSFLHPSDSLYAEIPFGLLAVLFLICLRHDKPRSSAAAGLLAAGAYLLRTAGLALLAVWVVDGLLHRRYRQAAVRAACAALPVVAWQAHVARVTGGPEYHAPAYPYQRAAYNYANVTYGENSWLVSPFRPELGRTSPADLVTRVGRNLLVLPRSIGESAWIAVGSAPYLLDKARSAAGLPVPPRDLVLTVTGACLAAIGASALLGASVLLRRGEWLFPLFYGSTLAMICLTPWPEQFWRYLAPLTPLSFVFLIVALHAGARRLAARGAAGRAAGATLAVAPLAGMLLAQVIIAAGFLRGLQPVTYYAEDGRERRERLLTYEPVWQALDPAFDYIRRHAAAEDIVATSVPHLAYLRTGRRAVLLPLEAGADTAARYLDAVPARYLVLDELGRPGISERYGAPVVARFPDAWQLVYTTPGTATRVYQRMKR